jgi:hypothetical protein
MNYNATTGSYGISLIRLAYFDIFLFHNIAGNFIWQVSCLRDYWKP